MINSNADKMPCAEISKHKLLIGATVPWLQCKVVAKLDPLNLGGSLGFRGGTRRNANTRLKHNTKIGRVVT